MHLVHHHTPDPSNPWYGLSTSCGMSLGQVKGDGSERVLDILPAATDLGQVTCPDCLERLAERVEHVLSHQPGPVDHLSGSDLDHFADTIGLIRDHAPYELDGWLRVRIEHALGQGTHSG